LVINFITERDEPFLAKLEKLGSSQEEWPSEPEHKPVPVKIIPAALVKSERPRRK
jgi:hypothetical protein